MTKFKRQHFVLAFVLVSLSLSLQLSESNAHNITQILNKNPHLSVFNNYLSQTKLADEINSRSGITVLALDNAAMSVFTSKNLTDLKSVKNVLSLHVLLDYVDPTKIRHVSQLSTTLYQTTGMAQGRTGFLNITLLNGGKLAFASASDTSSEVVDVGTLIKPIYTPQEPYTISVLQISRLIIPSPAFLQNSPPANLSSILLNGGHKMFMQLLSDAGVMKTYEDAMSVKKALTVFAPTDEALKGGIWDKMKRVSSAEKVAILEYHAVAEYKPLGSLKISDEPMETLGSNEAFTYVLNVSTSGGMSVILNSGVNMAIITAVIADEPPAVAVYSIDSLLNPPETFGLPSLPFPMSLGPSLSASPSPSDTLSSAMRHDAGPATLFLLSALVSAASLLIL